MIFRWFAPVSQDHNIASLYGAIVAQARKPSFYQIYGVPDTVNGRLEMIILHAVMVLRRLSEDAPMRPVGQALFDHFCRDMDGNMREMGVGDLAVPRKMRRIGEAFYGRQAAYALAFAPPHNRDLIAAFRRNVFSGRAEIGEVARLASYCRAAARHLSAQNGFDRGEISFPDPEEVQVTGND
jgi:cytochrome b pre-mRNA-processing protein 3